MTMQFNKVGSEGGIICTWPTEVFFELKEALKGVGWTVPRSSDGSTYNPAGDQIATPADLDNSHAWFEIAAPDGKNHFIIQRGTVYYYWRVKWAEAPFDQGSPDATTVGGAAEERLLVGSGTDASPSYTWYGTGPASQIVQVAVDDAAPWGWWCHVQEASSRQGTCFMMMDPLRPGSYAPDPNPVVVAWWNGDASLSGSVTNDTLATKLAGTDVWVGILEHRGWGGSTTAIFPGGAGSDPADGSDLTMPLHYGRNPGLGAPSGWRGYSSLIELNGSLRLNGDTGTRLTTRDRICLLGGEGSFAWNGTVPVI